MIKTRNTEGNKITDLNLKNPQKEKYFPQSFLTVSG